MSSEAVPGPRGERRATGEQRRYNRRSPVSDAQPPYFEIFDRIASALEGIEHALNDLASRSASTPSAPPSPRGAARG